MNRIANFRYSGHNDTASTVAHINGGKKLEAVHNASATRTRANTTRAFVRAPGPSGSGFCVSVLAAAKRGFPPVGCFAPSFAFFSMVAPRERPLSRGG